MIKLLPKSVSDKIAAGEVVERPVSVVKELIENSIDAGAQSIVCEIKKGGTEYIRITDDGCGIPAGEAEMAFVRHATSKIESAGDLDALNSLGFRGEALASVAAVSRVRLITKIEDEKSGTSIAVEGSKIIESKRIGAPEGTSIEVSDLFFNTPARRKFLKSKAAEANAIIELVTSMAIVYPDIKFRMINNGSILFSTRGTGRLKDVLSVISGNANIRNLIYVDGQEDGMRLSGYVSGPGESRATKKGQLFAANGRIVDSKVIERGLMQAYKERLFEGRYPVAYLFIDIAPEMVDVNIHPNKREIRFDDNEKVTRFVENVVKRALMSLDAVPEVSFQPKPASHNEDFDIEKDTEQVDVKKFLSSIRSDSNINNKDINDPDDQEQFHDASSIKYLQDDIGRTDIVSEQVVQEYKTSVENKTDISGLNVIGVLFTTYILAEMDDVFYLIDQHAAHERVFYEKLTKEMFASCIASQMLISPITFDNHVQEDNWMMPLKKMGFEIDIFGPGIFAARAIPHFFDLESAEVFLKDYVDSIGDDIDFESQKIKDMLALKACKAAVKANDVLSAEEIGQLIYDLSRCDNPFSCPHGRPTLIKMSKYEIEKRFKRV